MNIKYEDVLEILGYTASKRRVLEIIGYEFSPAGMEQYRQERPNIVPILIDTIKKDIENVGIFPRAFFKAKPEAYCAYIEKSDLGFTLVEIDKPDGLSRSLFNTVDKAAQALIRISVDACWHPNEDENK